MTDVGLRMPMLDLFRRGEVARDVKVLAAQGGIAPRPMEQLAILAHLTADPEAEIRDAAEQTLRSLPNELIAGHTARPDAPTELVVEDNIPAYVVIDPYDYYQNRYKRGWSGEKRNFNKHHNGVGWKKHWKHHQKALGKD